MINSENHTTHPEESIISIVERESRKRRICPYVVKNISGKDLEKSLIKLNIIPGLNAETNLPEYSGNIGDNLLNMKFQQQQEPFWCQKCCVEINFEEEG
jgi:hypothetical protein